MSSASPGSDDDELERAHFELVRALERAASLRHARAWDPGGASWPDVDGAVARVFAAQGNTATRAETLASSRNGSTRPPLSVDLDPDAASDATALETGLILGSAEALDATLQWAAEQGVFVDSRLAFAFVDGVVRVTCTRPIAAGEVLLRLPHALVVDTWAVANGDPSLARWLNEFPTFGPSALVVWLLWCTRDDVSRSTGRARSTWKGYVDALPRGALNTALTWRELPPEVLPVANHARTHRHGVLRLYVRARAHAASQPLDARVFGADFPLLRAWLWAAEVACTRLVAVGTEQVLLPILDLLPRTASLDSTGAQHVLEGGEGVIVLRAGVSLDAGEAVELPPGAGTPAEHWVQRGARLDMARFGPPDGSPPRVAFPLPLDAPLRREKLLWVLADPGRTPEVRLDVGDGSDAMERARWYATDADELESLGASSVGDLWGRTPTLSDRGEARARAMLEAWLHLIVGAASDRARGGGNPEEARTQDASETSETIRRPTDSAQGSSSSSDPHAWLCRACADTYSGLASAWRGSVLGHVPRASSSNAG